MAAVSKNSDAGLMEDGPAEENQTVYLEPEIQRQLVRKIDLNLMPLVVSLCKSSLPLGGENATD
jgi:hypothetical protein